MGIKKGIEVREEEEWRDREEMARKVKLGKKWWRIVGVYVNGDIESKIDDMRSWMENKEEENENCNKE